TFVSAARLGKTVKPMSHPIARSSTKSVSWSGPALLIRQRRSIFKPSSLSRTSFHAATRSATVSPLIQPCGQSFSKLSEFCRTKCFAGASWPANFERQISLNFEKDWPQGWIKGDTVAERVALDPALRPVLLEVERDLALEVR